MAAAASPGAADVVSLRGPLADASPVGVETVLADVFNPEYPTVSLREAVLCAAKLEDPVALEKILRKAPEMEAAFGRPIDWYNEGAAAPDLASCMKFAQQFLEGDLEPVNINNVFYPHPFKIVSKQKALHYKLTQDEIAAIRFYTLNTNFFRWLNMFLRSKERDWVRPFFHFIRLLMTALAKLPKFEGQELFRGMTQDLSARFPLQRRYQGFQFESFSTNYKMAIYFANRSGINRRRTLQTFLCENFSGATNITWFSRYPFEDEVAAALSARYVSVLMQC